MKRRQVIGVAAAAFGLWIPAAFAQPTNTPRVGWLWSGRSTYGPNEVKGFQQGLRDLGYIEGQTVLVEYRFGEGTPDRMNEFAAELLRLRVDVLVAIGGPAV